MNEVDRWSVGPVPTDEIRARQAQARHIAANAGLEALVVIGRSFYDRPGSLAYLTNHFPPFPASVFSEDARGLGHGVFIMPAEGSTVLLADSGQVRRNLVVADEIYIGADLVGQMIAYLKARKLVNTRIGLVGADILPWLWYTYVAKALPDLTFIPADKIVENQRRIKSESEIRRLREAAEIVGVGLQAALDAVIVGASELEVNAAGTGAAMRAGADFVRYLRVHSGPWAVGDSRWPQAMDRKLETGDLVNLDLIGAHRGYGFDVLRTTVVGTPNDKQRILLETTAAALEAVLKVVRPGVEVITLLNAAGKVAEEAGVTLGRFLGHGIGLETMETPFLKRGSRDHLEAGMVLCIEPQCSLPGIGWASIEQEVVVRQDGPELLSDKPPVVTW